MHLKFFYQSLNMRRGSDKDFDDQVATDCSINALTLKIIKATILESQVDVCR